MASAVVFWIVPPDPLLLAPPSPLTIKPPLEPVEDKTIPLAPPFLAMLRKVILPLPIVELLMFKHVPVPEEIVFPVPVTFIAVAPPVALNPVPVVVVITRPPPENVIVALVFEESVTPEFAPVFKILDAPENVFVPPPQFCTLIPVPVEVIFPENITLLLS